MEMHYITHESIMGLSEWNDTVQELIAIQIIAISWNV